MSNQPSSTDDVDEPSGASPYATGGGGVTFAHQVAAGYLAAMLRGERRIEIAEQRIGRISFQTGPKHPVDDLLLTPETGNAVAIACRATPHFVTSDDKTVKLIRSLIDELSQSAAGQVAIAVAGWKPEWEQVATVCDIARSSSDYAEFRGAMQTDGRWSRQVRDRYDHLVKMADIATGKSLGEPELLKVAWNWLSRLRLLGFKLQSPDASGWTAIATGLDAISARPLGGLELRDRLLAQAAGYDASGATVDIHLLRRDVHDLTDKAHDDDSRRILDQYRSVAFGAVRRTLGVAANSTVPLELPFAERRRDIIAQLETAANDKSALIVTGISGTGKSALVLSAIQDFEISAAGSFEAIVLNFRELPQTSGELEHILGCSLETALLKISAPQRLLVIDAADAASERSPGLLRDLVAAAFKANLGVVAVSAEPAYVFVRDVLADIVQAPATFTVEPLSDDELSEIAKRFPLLQGVLNGSPKTSLLRRLIVVDLIARTGLELEGPISEWDCLAMIWKTVVRAEGSASHGSHQAREEVLLALAASALGDSHSSVSLGNLDATAVDALRVDYLLAPASLYGSVPEFAHDEVRRYATALYLVKSGKLSSLLLETGVPRWSLSAVTLACKGILLDPSVSPAVAFQDLATAFQAIGEQYGLRWADVPVEAVLETPLAFECIRVALDSPDATLALQEVVRVARQRFSFGGLVDQHAGSAIVRFLTEKKVPWDVSKESFDLLVSWLKAKVVANAPAGDPTRELVRQRLLDYWAAFPVEPASEDDKSSSGRTSRRRDLDYHLVDEEFVETLALLGADEDDATESCLRLIAQHAPAYLAPAVDSPLSARSIAQRDPELLADLIEAYYIDDSPEDEWGGFDHDEGVRQHQGNWMSIGPPFDSYWYGGFWQLFSSATIATSVRVLNRLLNHAAQKRVEINLRMRSRRAMWAPEDEPDEDTESERASFVPLQIDGRTIECRGDGSVWSWYRGFGVGPYPCMSALEAMERFAEQLLETKIAPALISKFLLEGCENLAVPGLLFGLFTRHLEEAGDQLDSYLAEPAVWELEFSRAASESYGFRASSEGLVHADRRAATPREISVWLMTTADEERRAELREVGQKLIENGRKDRIDDERILGWAANLDDSRYQLSRQGDYVYLEVVPPEQVAQAQALFAVQQERSNTTLRLENQYWGLKSRDREFPISDSQIIDDLAAARSLVEANSADSMFSPINATAHVIKAAVARAVDGGVAGLESQGPFAINFLIDIARGFIGVNRRDEGQYFDLGADRAVALSFPALATPQFKPLLDEAAVLYNDVIVGGTALATNASFETRLYLARGCDSVWKAPCTSEDCFHHIAMKWLFDTARGAEIGKWDNEAQRMSEVLIEGDVLARLRVLDPKLIDFADLSPAIRGLGVAATAGICVSDLAKEALLELMAIQQESVASHQVKGRSVDDRGVHALISARALLQGYAASGDSGDVLLHIDTVVGNAGSLMNFLHGLAAAGAEDASLASAARDLWPLLLQHILSATDDRKEVFKARTWGSWAVAALLPSPLSWTSGLYNELLDAPIDWVDAELLIPYFDDWAQLPAHEIKSVDAMIRMIRKLPLPVQVTNGLRWITDLCIRDSRVVVSRSYTLNDWLKELRSHMEADDALARWQFLVDALVVAGNSELAEFSA